MKSESVLSEWSALLEIQRVTHTTLHALGARLAEFDLTASEINALASLADDRSRTVSELAAATGGRPTTLTSVLDRLERRGYVTRGRRAGDRRSVLIELTDPGRRAAAAVRCAFTELESRALGGLPADAITGLRTALRALGGEPT